jgi:hypothetical protein
MVKSLLIPSLYTSDNPAAMTTLKEKLDRYAPIPMFLVTIAFLLVLGVLVHIALYHKEIPPWQATLIVYLSAALSVLEVFYVVEFFLHLLARGRWKQHLLFLFVPPLRLTARDCETGNRIWFPSTGWTAVNETLVRRVERAFTGPMLLIAVAVLPLLVIEYGWEGVVRNNPRYRFALDLGTASIWAAFTLEFIVMIAIVKKRIRYCKEHWIDIAIICIPLIAWARLLRLGRLLRLNYVVRAGRLYRLRGLLIKTYQSVLLLEFLRDRFNNPEKRLLRLEEQLAEKEKELDELKQKISRAQRRADEWRQRLDEKYGDDGEASSEAGTAGEPSLAGHRADRAEAEGIPPPKLSDRSHVDSQAESA